MSHVPCILHLFLGYMITIFDKKRQLVPLKIWMKSIRDLEDGAYKQAMNLTILPFVHHHIALMPDAHQGYGMPIGGVMAAKGVVVPYAVGLDIGCGVCAAQTRIHVDDFSEQRLRLEMKRIAKAVPQGFNWHKKKQSDPVFDRIPDDIEVVRSEAQNVRYQLGTLGGGNHFIEFQRDRERCLWMMVHCGSRNFGKKVADSFHRKAVKRCREAGEKLPTSELSYFRTDDKTGGDYLRAMNWALDFARANRRRIMEVILDILGEIPAQTLDIHHNYAAKEKHYGAEVVLHRKGATKADKGLRGIIPGSMGTHSYLVEGMGSEESFCSCSHGAGRKLGRKQARRSISAEDVLRRMDRLNIVVSVTTKKDIPEEAPEAYKDIDEVMANQSDLIKITNVLYPLGVIKG